MFTFSSDNRSAIACSFLALRRGAGALRRLHRDQIAGRRLPRPQQADRTIMTEAEATRLRRSSNSSPIPSRPG